ncbi:Protein cornichon, partial [Trichinella patagoniensis]
LKTDYRSPIEHCNCLNPLIIPEYGSHLLINILFLLSMQFGSLMWNVPLLSYHIHRYLNRPIMSAPGIYDPTTILNADNLRKALREGWIKLAFYTISFFYYIYSLSKRTMKNEIPHDIIIEPSSCLFFNGPFDEVKSQSVRLRNPGRHPVAWAIKTNNRTRLNADPPGSILQPGTQMMVKILSAPVRHPQMAKQDGDSIIFEWCEVEPETPFSIDLLKGDALLRRRKIKIHYNP